MSCLHRRPNRPACERPGAARVGLVVAVLASTLCASAGAQRGDGIAGIVLLPVGERASIVVDLNDPGPAPGIKASVVPGGGDRVFAIDIGPLHQSVAPRRLVATLSMPLVSDVVVRSVAQSGNASSARIQINGRAPIVGSVRQGPHRLYVDLTPRPAPGAGPGRAPSSAPASPTGAPAAAPGVPSGAVPPRSAVATAGSATPSPASESAPRARRDDEPSFSGKTDAALLAEAKALAERPDVKKVERIRQELLKRRQPAAAGASDDPAIVEVSGYLDQARRLQLEMDARKFKERNDARPSR